MMQMLCLMADNLQLRERSFKHVYCFMGLAAVKGLALPSSDHLDGYHRRAPDLRESVPSMLRIMANSDRAGADGQRTRLVTVPRFADCGTMVLVNLATLACDPIVFDSSLD